MTRPKILDLYCCAGGAAVGYHRAGFDVYGIDINPQPRYPFAFRRDDALATLALLLTGEGVVFDTDEGPVRLWMEDFVAIHASPPCQSFSRTKTLHSNEHPDLVEPTRTLLKQTGKPWIIENVVGAPLIDPIKLCGSEFDMIGEDVDGVPLKMIRHRLFESNVQLTGKGGCRHRKDIQTASVYGAGGGWTPKHRDNPERRGGYIPHVDVLRKILEVDWTTKHELSQVVPPAFTEHLGRQLLDHI